MHQVKIQHVHMNMCAGSQFGLIAVHLIGVNSMPSNNDAITRPWIYIANNQKPKCNLNDSNSMYRV